MGHSGILLFQKASSIPERVELISTELLELYERSESKTDANKIYFILPIKLRNDFI